MKYLALERVLRRTGVGKIALPSFPEVSREYLEFLSIKLPGALLTSKLQHIKPGDRITVGH